MSMEASRSPPSGTKPAQRGWAGCEHSSWRMKPLKRAASSSPVSLLSAQKGVLEGDMEPK